MQILQNSVKPEKNFEIQNINGNSCEVIFYDNIKEKQDDEGNTIYEYEMYKKIIDYREGIEDTIEKNLEAWLKSIKDIDYVIAAAEMRKKRDELLKETDKEMCLDRLNIKFPQELSMTNILTGLKEFFDGFSSISNGKIAKYRQALRDVPQQEGFPYNIKWPNKEDLF